MRATLWLFTTEEPYTRTKRPPSAPRFSMVVQLRSVSDVNCRNTTISASPPYSSCDGLHATE
ncbi:unnamed protein product [Schistosoma mattheei]|uniref:Uncharacterized protein n=1 Tax=Schistosoma mattheei TaxID=31246 RepID=A0AA85BHH2_9TREM|nr:unnamed protein product [Schistosoma mattheei]